MENIYKDLHSNQKIFIYEMLKRGITVEIIDAEKEIIKTSYNGHDELICDRDSSIMPYNLSILAGDKGFTKRNLMMNGISVPIGETFLAKDFEYIKKAFKVLNCPVVIKPVFGIITDFYPIFGYKRKCYLLFCGIIFCVVWLILGFLKINSFILLFYLFYYF